MAKQRAPVLPPHTMQLFVIQCIASGLNAKEFGRRNGMTKEQSARLARLIRAATDQTARITQQGSIVPTNQAHSLSRLGNRMFNALMGQGTRAVETLERQNARYEPQMIDGVLSSPDFTPEDIRLSKWAMSVCSVIMAFVRKDGRDDAQSPADVKTLEPIQRVMEGAPPGMLTVVSDDGDGVQPEKQDA